MASFYGYIVLVVGLSLLLGFAGIQTTGGHLLGSFVTVNATSPTGNFTADVSTFNPVQNPYLIALFALIGIFLLVTGVRAALGGVFGIAETIKVTTVGLLLTLIILDFVDIIKYLNGVSYMGGVIKLAAFVVYIPIAIGVVVSAVDWIGGGR